MDCLFALFVSLSIEQFIVCVELIVFFRKGGGGGGGGGEGGSLRGTWLVWFIEFVT